MMKNNRPKQDECVPSGDSVILTAKWRLFVRIQIEGGEFPPFAQVLVRPHAHEGAVGPVRPARIAAALQGKGASGLGPAHSRPGRQKSSLGT